MTLAAVTVFFLLWPLTLGKPGLPPHLKADESAYYLAALSLAHEAARARAGRAPTPPARPSPTRNENGF